MCITQFRQVIAIDEKSVKLNDGRVARLAPIGKVKVGDTVEVYADLVIGKVEFMSSRAKSRDLSRMRANVEY